MASEEKNRRMDLRREIGNRKVKLASASLLVSIQGKLKTCGDTVHVRRGSPYLTMDLKTDAEPNLGYSGSPNTSLNTFETLLPESIDSMGSFRKR